MRFGGSHGAGIALAILAAFGFSFKAILVKLAYPYGVDAITLLALRMAFALPVFLWVGFCCFTRGAQAVGARLAGRFRHGPGRLLRRQRVRLPRPAIHLGGPRAAHPVHLSDADADFRHGA